jgi:hypothetical protein
LSRLQSYGRTATPSSYLLYTWCPATPKQRAFLNANWSRAAEGIGISKGNLAFDRQAVPARSSRTSTPASAMRRFASPIVNIP